MLTSSVEGTKNFINFLMLQSEGTKKEPFDTSQRYGFPYSSYHAIMALADTAEDVLQISSEVAILNSFNVDDIHGDGDTSRQVFGLFIDVRATLEPIGSSIRKWTSNSAEIMEVISHILQEKKFLFIGEHDHTISHNILGLNRQALNQLLLHQGNTGIQNQCKLVILVCPITKKLLIRVLQSNLSNFQNPFVHN